MSINVQNLTKAYGTKKAVDDISFDVHSGEIVGFLGPNGAGKTTTMRIITGFLAPTDGTAKVEGFDIHEQQLNVRKSIGYLPEHNPLYLDMNVLDYLEYAAQLQNVEKGKIPHRIREMVGMCGLSSVKHLDIGQLSKGFRQRVGLAQAMIHDPKVMILDEPTSGLDPNQIVEIRNLIRQVGKAKTVLLSTHILPEVEATCDRALIISNGKIVANGTTKELQTQFQGSANVYLEIERDDNATRDVLEMQLKQISSIENAVCTHELDASLSFKLTAAKDSDIRKQVYQFCVQKKLSLLELHSEQTSLEDVFHQLTTEKN
ncbi:MAG: ATP-binding cassette domain-containing protein [Ignavibacteria bacterium]|nr:ATP-binding cassette domain-containing protein [Ignavibacteria bacterium]